MGHPEKDTLTLDGLSPDFLQAFRERFTGAIEGGTQVTISVGLTHPWVIQAMESARARGYHVELHHVGTADSSVELEGRRMAAKLKQQVQARWHRRAALLSCAVTRSDQSTLYDFQGGAAVKLAQFAADRRTDTGEVVPWIDSQVLRPLKYRRADLADVEHKASRNGWDVSWADLLSPTPHVGLLGPAYSSVVAQYVPGGVLLHDRAVLALQTTHDLAPASHLVVDYAQWPAGTYAPLMLDRLPPVRRKAAAKAVKLQNP